MPDNSYLPVHTFWSIGVDGSKTIAPRRIPKIVGGQAWGQERQTSHEHTSYGFRY